MSKLGEARLGEVRIRADELGNGLDGRGGCVASGCFGGGFDRGSGF